MRKLSKRFLQIEESGNVISVLQIVNIITSLNFLLVLDHDWFSADVGVEEVKESRGKATGATSMQGKILLIYSVFSPRKNLRHDNRA